MLCTKHLYIFVVTGLSILLIFAFTLSANHRGEMEEAVFVTPQDSYAVAHNTPKVRSDRDGFIERVRQALSLEPDIVGEGSDAEEVLSAPEETGTSFVGASVSAVPRKGSVYVCATPSRDGTPIVDASWIRDGVLDETQKEVVSGQISSQFNFTSTVGALGRDVVTSGVPTHAHGAFANPPLSTAHAFTFTLPLVPVLATEPTCVPVGGPVAVLNSGAFLYSGVLEGNYDAQAHATFDACEGHVDTLGIYHYHGESNCVPKNADGGVGYAFDGFAIYSSVENGQKVTNEVLDACHGHTHMIPWNGVQTLMYHYHLTNEYPYSVGCFKGSPVSVEPGG